MLIIKNLQQAEFVSPALLDEVLDSLRSNRLVTADATVKGTLTKLQGQCSDISTMVQGITYVKH